MSANNHNCFGDTIVSFFFALMVGGFIAFNLYIIDTASHLMPKWVMVSTGILFCVATFLAYNTKKYNGLVAGGTTFFMALFAIFISQDIQEVNETTARIVNIIYYFPLFSGFISILLSLDIDETSNKSLFKGVVYFKDGRTQIAEIKKAHLLTDKPIFAQVRFYDELGNSTWTEGYGYQSRKIVKRMNEFFIVD